MSKPIWVLVIGLVLLLLPIASAQEEGCIYFFYGTDCPGCEQSLAYLDNLKTTYPNISIVSKEVYYDPENAQELEQFFTSYEIEAASQGVPALFLEDSYFIGERPIQEFLHTRVTENTLGCATLNSSSAVGVVGTHSSYEVLNTLTFGKVSNAALKDALSPPMIAFMLIVLISLSAIRKDEKIVSQGSIFVATLFVMTLLASFAIIEAFSTTTGNIFYRVVGLIAILAGFIKIRGIVTTWKTFMQSLPLKLRVALRGIRRSLTHNGSISLLALFASAFTLSHKSITFELIQKLFAQGFNRAALVPTILYYCLLFITIPILLVVILHLVRTHFEKKAHQQGEESEKQNKKWEEYYDHIITFSASLLMIVVGIVLIFL